MESNLNTFIILYSVIFVIVHEVNNPICVVTEASEDKEVMQISPETEVCFVSLVRFGSISLIVFMGTIIAF